MAYRAALVLLTASALLSAGFAPVDDPDRPADPPGVVADPPEGDAKARDTLNRSKADEKIPEAEDGGRVVKTDAEWRRQLTSAQFYVTRMKGTEQAWSGKYSRGKHHGTFVCVGCGAELFSSDHKFESGTGWPSFWRPIVPARVTTAPDYSGFEARVEVECTRCGAHLGHVFNDGPPPTGLRFCLNSVALKLRPPTRAKAASRAVAKEGNAGEAEAAPSKAEDQGKTSEGQPAGR